MYNTHLLSFVLEKNRQRHKSDHCTGLISGNATNDCPISTGIRRSYARADRTKNEVAEIPLCGGGFFQSAHKDDFCYHLCKKNGTGILIQFLYQHSVPFGLPELSHNIRCFGKNGLISVGCLIGQFHKVIGVPEINKISRFADPMDFSAVKVQYSPMILGSVPGYAYVIVTAILSVAFVNKLA